MHSRLTKLSSSGVLLVSTLRLAFALHFLLPVAEIQLQVGDRRLACCSNNSVKEWSGFAKKGPAGQLRSWQRFLVNRNKLHDGHVASTAGVEVWTEESFAEDTVNYKTAEYDSARTVEAIHERAEAVTPLLKEILTCRPPAHWGLND